jgi:hypothetical protein
MTNVEHLATLNIEKISLFLKFLNRVKKELGYEVIITRSYCSIFHQNELHKANKSNSTGGLSSHQYGFALDVNFIKGTTHLKKATSKRVWEASGIPQIAKECELRWGGDFDSYGVNGDNIHFDCVKPGDTTRWFNYLKKTYPNTYETFEANKTNWKFS